MHEEWTDKLSDYLDGELADDERRAVDAHLNACAACAAVLNDLRRVVARARVVAGAPRPPAADLWSGIAARIDPARRGAAGAKADAGRGTVAPFAPRVDRRVSFTLPQLAAAAALVAAVSGGLVWTALGRPEGLHDPTPVERSAGATTRAGSSADLQVRHDQAAAEASDRADRVVPVGMAEAQYDAAVVELERAVKQGRGRLDASTISIVEHNLQIIDQAIDQARDALAADPANTYLSGHLVEARRRKLELLRRAAALTTESD